MTSSDWQKRVPDGSRSAAALEMKMAPVTLLMEKTGAAAPPEGGVKELLPPATLVSEKLSTSP